MHRKNHCRSQPVGCAKQDTREDSTCMRASLCRPTIARVGNDYYATARVRPSVWAGSAFLGMDGSLTRCESRGADRPTG